MSIPELAAVIENRFRAEPRKPFPHDEIDVLNLRCATEEIVTDLDTFHSVIDGYADSARALTVCGPEKLLKVKRDMARSFFEVFPRNKSCQDLITEKDTPVLYARMRVAEELRRDLLLLVDGLLREDGAAL
jgi:hypothetical protein